jgi:hypothetical protein
MNITRHLLCFALLLLFPITAKSASSFEEVAGVRSLAMGGAHRALGTSNDTLKLNPAGLAIQTRYAIELHYAWSEKFKESRATANAVDSKSGPVAGGLGYELLKSELEGQKKNLHRISLGMAYRVGDMFALGTTIHYIEGNRDFNGEEQDIREFSSDLGLMIRMSDYIQLGATWHNFVTSQDTGLSPQHLGLGISGGGQGFVLTFDSDLDLESEEIIASYHTGAEYIVGNNLPLRIGYMNKPRTLATGEPTRENFITGGFGYLSQSGSVDISCNHSVERARVWTVIGALHFFL